MKTHHGTNRKSSLQKPQKKSTQSFTIKPIIWNLTLNWTFHKQYIFYVSSGSTGGIQSLWNRLNSPSWNNTRQKQYFHFLSPYSNSSICLMTFTTLFLVFQWSEPLFSLPPLNPVVARKGRQCSCISQTLMMFKKHHVYSGS